METHIRYLACGSGDILAFRSIYELPLELYAQIAELATYFAAEDNLSGRGTDFPMADWEDIVQWLDDGEMQAMRESIERCEWSILQGTEDDCRMAGQDTMR